MRVAKADNPGTLRAKNLSSGTFVGPGAIIGPHGPNAWWVSYGGRAYLVSPEHLTRRAAAGRITTAGGIKTTRTRTTGQTTTRILRNCHLPANYSLKDLKKEFSAIELGSVSMEMVKMRTYDLLR